MFTISCTDSYCLWKDIFCPIVISCTKHICSESNLNPITMYSDVVLRQTNKYNKSLNSTSDSKEQIFISLHIRSMWETICDPTASLLGWLSLSDSFSQWPSILCIHRCRWFTFSEWPSILCIHRCRLWLKVTYFLYWQLPPVENNI